jgi:hypothetical protein
VAGNTRRKEVGHRGTVLMEWRNRTGHGLAGDESRSAMKVAAVVATDAVRVPVAATVAAAAAATVALAAAAAGSVAGTAVAEIAAERIVGKSTEARLGTWYEDSERP